MALTLASLAEDVRQELGRPPGKSTSEALVNEAGQAWVNSHSWVYLRERRQTIDLVADTENYRLALGVRAVGRVLHRPDSTWTPITLWDYQSFLAERERYLSAIDRTFTPIASVHWDTQATDTEPRLYLQVYPATLTETVVVEYQAGWLPMDESNSVADIPVPLEHGFREWVRRYAMGREKMPQVTVDAAWVSFFSGPVGISSKTADAEHTGVIMPTPGGAGVRYAMSRARRRGAGAGLGFYDRARWHGLGSS